MVVLDAATLLLFLVPDAGVPLDSTGQPIELARERLAYLVKRLEIERTKIIVPTPALSEVLVRAGPHAARIASGMEKSARVEIVSFDIRAAVEVAMMTREALDAGDKRGGSTATWAKVKYDRQIVAIAKVAGANTIYTDDRDIRAIAPAAGIRVFGIGELPLPPAEPQQELPLEAPQGRRAADEAIPPTGQEDDVGESDDPEPPADAVAEIQGDGSQIGKPPNGDGA